MEPQGDFEALRRLLALKRHEQPPPGFFERFPNQVMARIELELAAKEEPWWRRFVVVWELKPAWAGALGGVLVMAYAFGVGLLGPGAPANHGVGQFAVTPPSPLVVTPELAPLSPRPGPLAQRPGVELAAQAAPSSMQPVVGSGPPAWLFQTPQLRSQSGAVERASVIVSPR